MHTHSLDQWHHGHVFLGEKHERHERRTWFVVALTAATMVAEIIGGTLFRSMAVVADGVHMSTHMAALAIAALAYRFARRHAADARFSFGTGKLGELAAFASALILLLIALLIGYESVARFLNPIAIKYDEAIAIACIGLAVNLASAWLLPRRRRPSPPCARSQHPRRLCARPRRRGDVGAGNRRAADRSVLWPCVDGRAGRDRRRGRDHQLGRGPDPFVRGGLARSRSQPWPRRSRA
jgi:Co/Zn/Cd efflux system component